MTKKQAEIDFKCDTYNQYQSEQAILYVGYDGKFENFGVVRAFREALKIFESKMARWIEM